MLIESLAHDNILDMANDRPPSSDSNNAPLTNDNAPSYNQWDDVFESDHPTTTTSTILNRDTAGQPTISHDFLPSTADNYASDVVYDYERLRSTHATAGYRDGISVGKATSVQTGFDEGFALGGEIGRAVGYIIGCVQGIAAASGPGDERISAVLASVMNELRLERVFAPEYVSEEGLWKYEVVGEEDGDVTFAQVAWAHPLVVLWMDRLDELAKERGVDLGALGRQMGDPPAEEEDYATEIR